MAKCVNCGRNEREPGRLVCAPCIKSYPAKVAGMPTLAEVEEMFKQALPVFRVPVVDKDGE